MPAEPTPAKAPINAFSAAAASSNPFANASFASSVSSPKPTTSSAVNPFAAVSFAATPANKTVGLGRSAPIATSTKKIRPTTTSFAPRTPAPVSKPLAPLRSGAKENENIDVDESTKKNLKMLKVVQMESNINPLGDYTPFLKEYIQNNSESNSNANGNSNGASLFGNGAKSSALPAGSAPKTTFSFAAAAAPAVPKENSGDAALKSESTPLFSFASSPAAPAEPKPFTGFSFGNASAASSTPTPAAAPVEREQEQEESAGNEDDGTPGIVAGDLAENEKELNSCRAKYLRRVPSQDDPKKMEWKAFAAGVLRLYKNSDDGKCKVVLRDAAGKVRLNLNIAKGTKFVSLPAKNGTRGVQFLSIMEQEVGVEQFILKTKVENFEKLVKALESMA